MQTKCSNNGPNRVILETMSLETNNYFPQKFNLHVAVCEKLLQERKIAILQARVGTDTLTIITKAT